MTKNLKGSDIILNLEEINIMDIDSRSSSSCYGRVGFHIDCETKHGYCEDPDFTGKIKILDSKKSKDGKSVYVLKVKFEKDEEGSF